MIHIVLGTKAQLIKMAPVMLALKQAGLPYRFITTGQHQETMADILDNFGLDKPDYCLYQGSDITRVLAMAAWLLRIAWHTLTHRQLIFANDTHGIVLVHGDTFSTLLGAIMAKIAGLKVGHVESGLRSFNVFHPFPEEMTRLLTFCLADYYFCPGNWALDNLKRFNGAKIDTRVNTLVDAIHYALLQDTIDNVSIPKEKFAIVTIHRFENIYKKSSLERIVRIVEAASKSCRLLFILHKPTEIKLHEFCLYEQLARLENLEFRQRYDFFRFVRLVHAAEFVISDGGSNQEECFYLGKPVLLLRQATERQEGLGQNCLLSQYQPDNIRQFIENYPEFRKPAQVYDFSPSAVIAEACRDFASFGI